MTGLLDRLDAALHEESVAGAPQAAGLQIVGREAWHALTAALAENAALREALEALSTAIAEGLCDSGTPADDGGIADRLDAAQARARAALATPAPALEGSDWNKALDEAAFFAQEGESPVAAAIRGLKRGGAS